MHQAKGKQTAVNLQGEYEALVLNPREVPLEEFIEKFSLYDLQAVDLYQTNTENKEVIVGQPFPADFTKQYGSSVGALIENMSTYEDDVEDALAEDMVILRLMEYRRKDTNNKNVVNAIKARRSVIVAILALSDLSNNTLA